MFAKIKNNQIEKFPIMNIRDEFPNVSFPLDMLECHIPDGYVQVLSSNPPNVSSTQQAIPDTPVEKDGKWYLGWKIIELNDI
jgi:hypothetical protein